MASRRKRKRPLPEWVGESYNSSNKKEDEEGRAMVAESAEPKDGSQSSSASGVSQNSSGTYAGKKNQFPTCYRRGEQTSGKGEPESAEEIIRMSLPLLKFDGSLIYSHNRSECSVLCEELMADLSGGGDAWHVGLDMEWPVTYQSGVTKKVALIQVCTGEDKCYLFHVAPMGALPDALKDLLSHTQIIKYGINIEADFWKLERDFDNIQVRSIIQDSVTDLGKLANAKLKSSERWTLDGLSRNVLRKRLNKEETVRCGRWDDFPLSEEQLEYAAADAYASFLLADRLRDK